VPVDKNELRRVMGHFATGVAIITTRSENGKLHGLTANAVTSVSLVPPLVLVCVDKGAESYPCFEQSRVFTVNILANDQEELSRRFAISGGDKFRGVSYALGANGAPLIHGALGHLQCRVTAAYEGGDHTIYLGEVQEVEASEAMPLLFFRGSYRRISEE